MAAATRPVAIKIDADIKERAKRPATRIAQCTGPCVKQSPNMSSAREAGDLPSGRNQGLGRIQHTGSHATAEEADAWLVKLEEGQDAELPEYRA